jgi:hypothetical protein
VAYEIAQDLLTPPLLEGLFLAERVTEIDRAREVLLSAVEAVRGEQLLGPQNTQRVEQLGADFVLPAVSARRRHERHARAHMPRIQRQHSVVLIVRMRRRQHDRAGVPELTQRERQTRCTRQIRQRRDAVLWCGLLSSRSEAAHNGDRPRNHEPPRQPHAIPPPYQTISFQP